DPRVRAAGRAVGADAVQHRQAIVLQTALADFEIGPVVLPADVFEHADRIHRVEFFLDIAVILQADFDGQALAQLARELRLLFGHSHTNARHAVFFRGVFQRLAPAAADVE